MLALGNSHNLHHQSAPSNGDSPAVNGFSSGNGSLSGNGSVESLIEVLHNLFPWNWRDPEAFEKGIRLNIQGGRQAAVEIFEDLVATEPDAYPAHHLLGYFYGCLGMAREEMDCYKKALKLKPDCPQILLNLGVAHWLMGKEKKALATFKEAVVLAPDFAIADHWLTVSFDRLGRYGNGDDANGTGSKVKTHVFNNACNLLGYAYMEFKMHPAARQAFKKAVRINPDSAEANYQLGALHIKKLRNPKRAAKYLGRAENLFIKQSDLQSGAFAHQLKRLKELEGEDCKWAGNWLKEGLRLQGDGRYQAALDAYKVALCFQKKFVEAYYNMGIAYGCLADLGTEPIDLAIGAFQNSLRIKSDFIHAHIALGASHIKNNELDKAVEVLEEAARLKPPMSEVSYYLGVARRMSGQFPEAVDALQRAVQLKSDSVQAYYYLGLTYLDMERFAEARAAIQEAVRIKPDFAAGHHMLGNILYVKLVDIENALTHLKKAEKLYLKMEDYQQASRVRQLLTLHKE